MSRGLRERLAEAQVDWIVPDWPVSSRVCALVTTRHGGVSAAPFDTLNLGLRSGDDPAAVRANRRRLNAVAGCTPVFLRQQHGSTVVDIDRADGEPEADAAVARTSGRAAAVLAADCLPVLLADRDGTVVGAAHAGWRGLAAGVVEATVAKMGVAPDRLVAWLGPAIGPGAFEVGDEVRAAFCAADADAATCFAQGRPGKWFADLYALARRRLAARGVREVYGGGACTVTGHRFFSYRRDRTTGRMAALVWRID